MLYFAFLGKFVCFFFKLREGTEHPFSTLSAIYGENNETLAGWCNASVRFEKFHKGNGISYIMENIS